MMKNYLIAALLSSMLAGPAFAADPAANGISVTDAWARATPTATSNAAVYLTVKDNGPSDVITSVATPVAAQAQMHQSKMQGTVMQMLPVDSISVAQGSQIQFKSGGYHIMLMGLKQPLKAGDSFPLTLTFQHAGEVSTTVQVKAANATSTSNAAPAMDMKDMDMSGMDMK